MKLKGKQINFLVWKNIIVDGGGGGGGVQNDRLTCCRVIRNQCRLRREQYIEFRCDLVAGMFRYQDYLSIRVDSVSVVGAHRAVHMCFLHDVVPCPSLCLPCEINVNLFADRIIG